MILWGVLYSRLATINKCYIDDGNKDAQCKVNQRGK